MSDLQQALLALGIGAIVGAIARLVWWICRRPRGRHPRTLAVVGVGLGLVLALTACTAPPTHGIVHQKHYSAPYTWTSLQCIAYRSKGGCAAWMPVHHYEPARYELDVYASSKDHGWVDVDQPAYDHVHVGDYWRQ
jgi:hypothetical protein